ncbi:ankyrin repeat protein [Seiridium cupressi]
MRARASSEPGRRLTRHEPLDTDGQEDQSARRSSSNWDPEPGFAQVDGDVKGPGYNETKVDIIAIPCPGASPIETWTRDPFPDGSFGSPPNDLWVQQGLRSKINIARVLLYKHRELHEGLTLENLADDLLDRLSRMRESHEGARPMFFICHSIGGLVAKHALVKASRNKDLLWINYNCHGMTFFATPHRGSSYLSMPNLRDSIQHLLYLARPLPDTLSDQLRLNNKPLLKLHSQFIDIASEMHIWTFYETLDSQLSGFGASHIDQVHFSAPLASIKSTLVGSRHEQAFSLESEHAVCASFGQRNSQILVSYLDDLKQAVQKAERISSAHIHTPLKLAEHVKLELIGFYDDPDPETISDVRLYVSKHPLNEFLEKGPEKCLSERLNTMAADPRRGSQLSRSHSRPISSGGLSQIAANTLGIWSNVHDFGQRILSGGSPRSDRSPDSPEQAEGPEIVVTSHIQRPSITDVRPTTSEPTIMPRQARGLSIPPLTTPGYHRPESRSSSRSAKDSNETARTVSDLTGTELSPHTAGDSASLQPQFTGDAVPGIDERDFNPASRQRKDRISRASALQDLTAGFSRPDPTKRKFMWIHLPYNNPHWVKSIFDKLSDTQRCNYKNLLRDEYCLAAVSCQQKPTLPVRRTWAELAIHHSTAQITFNLIRRRNIVQRRMEHGRARPVPKDVADNSSLDMKVIWEFIGHDPPLNARRTLDQYGYPSLRDTYARDDDQMMYKLTKERVPFDKKKTDMFGTRAMKEQSPISPADRLASAVNAIKSELVMYGDHEPAAKVENDILDGNILMIDQLWLWAVDTTTIATFFPKRESPPTEGPMFQQADLRNSVYNELNGDLTGRCENALDLAAFVALHAVTVLLDRTSHPDLEVFRIFEEAIGILTERMTSALKRFRMQTFRDTIHDSDSSDSEFDDYRSESIKKRHKRELEQAERENRENTSALLELRDMDDELKTLRSLFSEQTLVIKKMRDLYSKEELREYAQNGRRFLDEALSRIGGYEKQVEDMTTRIAATRTDYEKLLEMVQRKAQVDEVRWSRLQTELASTQNLSVIIFTTFTVIFLPLSFFTSLFGMNTSDWAGDEGNSYISLKSIGAISLPSSFAIIALALIAAFSSRVQGVVDSLFKTARKGWDGAKYRVSKMQSDKHKESKLEKRRLKQERDRLSKRQKERGYDFWETREPPAESEVD